MEDSKILKKGFFKKVWYSIFKIEKYGEMAAEGVPRAIFYIIKLALIIALITAIGAIFQANKLVEKGKDFIENQVGEFTYKEGILSVEKEEQITAPSSQFGQIIINTSVETDEEINEILNSIQTSKGIVFLKDRAVAKGFTTKGLLVYKYADIMSGTEIEELNKQDLIDFFGGDNLWKIYLAVLVVITLYMLLSYTLQFLWYNVVLSLFGFVVTYFSKIKMRYAAVFNMACYAFTLSILLQGIYVLVNIFWNFEMKYFQVMYVAVAAIYLIAAIFLIRAEFIKQQVEMVKMSEIKKQEDDEKEENKEDNKEEKKQEEPKEKEQPKDKKKEKNGAEPEGSQA
ncbi:MAG: DUF1189 domain-containing protein [Clostridia bacterium]|nr:DUF1189 domain-containing protein [Clostridia bacterium]